MKIERTKRIEVSAEEIMRLLGVKGKIVTFATPSRQDYPDVSERSLLIILKEEEES